MTRTLPLQCRCSDHDDNDDKLAAQEDLDEVKASLRRSEDSLRDVWQQVLPFAKKKNQNLDELVVNELSSA